MQTAARFVSVHRGIRFAVIAVASLALAAVLGILGRGLVAPGAVEEREHPGAASLSISRAGLPAGIAARRPALLLPPAAAPPAPSGVKTKGATGDGTMRIARNATISIFSKDVARTIDRIRTLAVGNAGAVVDLHDESPSDPDEPHTASLRLSVPSRALDGVMREIGTIGAIRSRGESAESVGDRIVDDGARLRNLRREESDLLRIMDRSGKIGDVLDVETHLADVRGQIERLDADLAQTQRRVAMATLDVAVSEERRTTAPAEPSGASRIALTWEHARRGAAEAALALVAIVIWTIAFLPHAAVAAALALVARRLARRRLLRAP